VCRLVYPRRGDDPDAVLRRALEACGKRHAARLRRAAGK